MLLHFLFITCMLLSRMNATSALSTCGPAALIFMHGLGDTPTGWSSLAQMLPSIKPRLKDVKYVFPRSPTVPITINGGMEMPGWFDVLDWPIGISARDDRDGMMAAMAQIETSVQELENEGIARNRIVIGGFSQGGAIALLTAYRSEYAFAGCVSLSGWLTLREDLKISDGAKQTPLFWGHGEYDDKVLFEQQAHGVEILQKQGVSVTAKSYPVGHSSYPDEMDAMASFLDELLYGKQVEEK